MFRIFFFAVALIYAKDWVHYTGQNEVRDVVRTEDGTLWAAFAWGLQERQANKTENTYMPGSNSLEAADFVQLFTLPGGDIIAASKNGILVRKNKNYKNFETINNSFAEKKRALLQGLGERAENILILPFEDAIAFFDYEQKRSVITLTQVGTSSLEEYTIEKIVVKEDSIWVDLKNKAWKRHIDWAEIHDDRLLADPNSWKPANESFAEDKKPDYAPSNLKFPLESVKTISLIPGGDVLAWAPLRDDYNFFCRMQNEQWGDAFFANQSGRGDDQKNYLTKSLALLPNGNFAVGMWGPGLMTYNAANAKTGWWHSTNTDDKCPTMHESNAQGYTLIQGVATSPDFSGFVFSYVSEAKYGLGFLNNSGNAICFKSTEASSPVALSIVTRQNEAGEWEIYAAWKYSLASKDGGIDFYSTSQGNFFPVLQKKWTLSFGTPIDFAFDSRGVLWAVSESKIFYLSQKDEEWKEPSYIRGFGGGTISSLETDAQNGLWISMLGNGAYSFSQVNNSPDSLVAKQYKIKDGLLNEAVYDIAIDTIKGKVYFAHNLGVSVYSTALVRSASGYMQSGSPKPIAYPNPFRPGLHSHLTIDFISEKSSVYILDSSGKRVRLFKENDLRGGRLVWDGKNESGKFVAPGLYYYLAADGKNIAKGKILIER